MPRKNKSGKGKDQKGYDYKISYQPDWLKELRSSRKDKKGKKDTVTIFQNPEKHQKEKPGKTVRTRVRSDEGVDFTITLDDPKRAVKRIRVEYKAAVAAAAAQQEEQELQRRGPGRVQPGGGSAAASTTQRQRIDPRRRRLSQPWTRSGWPRWPDASWSPSSSHSCSRGTGTSSRGS
jgi:hypothetical protein